MRKTILLSSILCLFSFAAVAQEGKKPLSPPAKAEASFGGKSVVIDYSAPSKRDREIMGKLVPYGEVWRTGANESTKLTTAGDLMIGSLHVPAGKYALYTIPGKTEWTLIVSKQTDIWGSDGYDQAKDLGRVKMKVTPVKDTVETFDIGLKAEGKKGTLTFAWENTSASVPVTAH